MKHIKKYLITGGAGFVAFHYLNYLDSIQEEHIEVLCIDINEPDSSLRRKYNNIKVSYISLNLLDYKSLEVAILSFSPDYILHLASFSSVGKSWQDPIGSFMNNTNIFLNIVEVVRKANINCRILSVGSSEEYGNVTADHIPLKEKEILSPVSPYAIARVSQEMLSRCYVVSYKLDIILTRSFNHIGPRQRDLFVVPSFVKQILENIKKGNTENIILHTGDVSIVRDFVDVRDVVRAYHLLFEKGVAGELYNICSGSGHTLEKIISMIADFLKISVKTEVEADKVRPDDNKIIIGDNTKIKTATGWTPEISLENSLRDIILYWKNELKME